MVAELFIILKEKTMINLFRKKRKALADDNKALKYARYAFGEIVLVMIGILLALQVNTWNEARKQKKQEVTILNNLLVDLKKAEVSSLEEISKENLKLNVFAKLLSEEGRKVFLKNTNKDSIINQVLWTLNTITPVINTYSDLKNSGSLNLISNDIISQGFTSLEINIKDLNETLKDRLDVQQINIDNLVIDKFNFLLMNKNRFKNYKIDFGEEPNYAELLKQQNILNAIAIKFSFTLSSIRIRTTLLHDIQSLIKNIEEELIK